MATDHTGDAERGAAPVLHLIAQSAPPSTDELGRLLTDATDALRAVSEALSPHDALKDASAHLADCTMLRAHAIGYRMPEAVS